jgi:tetratricopeptide (TPR) repeat protein
MRHAETLIMNGKIDDAMPIIQQLKRTNDKVYLLAGSLFEGLVNEKFKKNDKAAIEQYVNVLKMQPNDRYTTDYFAMAYAGLARISIRSGNNKRAEELYRRCLEYAEYKSTVNEANNFLK